MMGLLDGLRKKKKSEKKPQKPKTPLRQYVENMVLELENVEVDESNIKGIPFGLGNPTKLLPGIVKNINDEMLEKTADFLLIVAHDIINIRKAEETKLLPGEVDLIENDEILDAEDLEVNENEIEPNTTELQKK